MEHKNAWLAYDEPQLAELEKLATNYIEFISANKTDKLINHFVCFIIKLLF